MALKRIPIPVRVELQDDGKRIAVHWQDGRIDAYSAFELRAECPCADCVDEFSGKRLLRREDVDPAVSAVAHGPVGRYAIQFQWSDGHRTGIYTYERLREGYAKDA
jgi:DUF971 family protein